VILTDTGPLVAALDAGDDAHEVCVAAMGRVSGPLVITWPVLTEAMYLLGERAGVAAQLRLGAMIEHGGVRLVELGQADLVRAVGLMKQYADTPMDFADASLVVVAERDRLPTVLTFDRRGFETYRVKAGRGHRALEVVP